MKLETVRVVYILGSAMVFGGTEAFIMNYYRNIDHNVVQIDFIYQGEAGGVYDGELLAGGSRIFHVPYKNRNPIAFTKQVTKILKENKYKIIHSQMDAMGAWPLAVAKHVGVPVRIAHSHNTSHQTNRKIKKLWNDIAKLLLRRYATDFYACGEAAGNFLFGSRSVKEGQVTFVHNAIHMDTYKFNERDRNKLRAEFGIEDAFVVGHVGQFREQKNHKFILEVFGEILKKRENSKLVLVGDGGLKASMEQYAKDLGIYEHVLFCGERNDVEKILNVFDVFLLPSLFEGLAVVAIEAQTNGLPTLISDSVSKKIEVTELVKRISLQESAEVWADEVLRNGLSGRKDFCDVIRECGYDITIEAKKLQEQYVKLWRMQC